MRNLFLLLLIVTSLPLAGATIQFEQGGWSLGGPLHVAFTGDDLDGDGALIVSELTAFKAVWKTPAGNDTVWLENNIEPDGFVFGDLANYVFFVRNSEFSMVNAVFEGEAVASVFDSFLFPVDSSVASPSEVPEPASLFLMGTALLGVGVVRRVKPRR